MCALIRHTICESFVKISFQTLTSFSFVKNISDIGAVFLATRNSAKENNLIFFLFRFEPINIDYFSLRHFPLKLVKR